MACDRHPPPVSQTREVVEGRLKGDSALRAELEGVVRKSWKKVLGICYRITRNRDLAEDLAQDAIEQALRSLASFDHRSSIDTWVCGIARNKSLARLRRRTEDLVEGEDSVLDPADPSSSVLRQISAVERTRFVQEAAKASLDLTEQQVVNLRYGENLSREHVANILDLDGGANRVRTILQTAQRRFERELRSRLTEHGLSTGFLRSVDTRREAAGS